METRFMLRLPLVVLLFLDPRILLVRAHLFSWLLDWQTLCDPDFIQCPNGGLTFRDHRHDCDFTPCAFIPDPPLPPPPPSPKTLSVQKWLGQYEFMVPTLNVMALRRGKALEREWAQAIVAKREQPLRVNFSATIDLYVVAPSPQDQSLLSAYVAHARDLHLDALLASQVELFVEEDGRDSSSSADAGAHGFSSTARELAVSNAPWTRWEFFGQFGGSAIPPTFLTIQTALRLLEKNTTTPSSTLPADGSGSFETLVVEAVDEADIMTHLLPQCDAALDTAGGLAFSSRKATTKSSVLVFTTDFRAAVGSTDSTASEDMLGPWNVTRVRCNHGDLFKIATAELDKAPLSASATIKLSDPSIKLLLRPRNASRSMDAGHGSDQDTLGKGDNGSRLSCSCWTRSLVTLNAGGHMTKWMLCN